MCLVHKKDTYSLAFLKEDDAIGISKIRSYLVLCKCLLQVLGISSISIGKSSSLPNSISKVNTIFDIGEKIEKFPEGPISPSPGPILFTVAMTEVMVVEVS